MVPKRQVVGAWLLLVGICSVWLGVAWDGQWHLDVGPDTFFTAPHLMFYFGSSLVGLTSLVVVLTGRPDADGPAVAVLGLRAPAAFLVGGLGAAGHLVYGATDLWWHTVYGFDILDSTPSHLSLQMAMYVQSVAVVMAFAALRSTRSGRWGLVLAAAFSVSAGTLMLDGFVFGVGLGAVGGAATAAWTLAAVAGVTRDARWLLALGGVFAAVLAVTATFPVLATGVYADGIGQPIRDNALGLPVVALAMPVAFPVVALIAGAVVRQAGRRGLPPVATMAVLGGFAGLTASVLRIVDENSPSNPALGVVAITAFGALAGAFGWRCAALLRGLGVREAVAA